MLSVFNNTCSNYNSHIAGQWCLYCGKYIEYYFPPTSPNTFSYFTTPLSDEDINKIATKVVELLQSKKDELRKLRALQRQAKKNS